MKKIMFGLGLVFLGSGSYINAQQQGLECVRVEKYYISNAADAAQADADATNASYPTGALPVGSVTYRIFVDMLPGYKLNSVYADTTRNQPLTFKTTTSFYNNPNGTELSSGSKSGINNNLLALDSWFTFGGVVTGNYGIPKTEDNGAANNITVAGNSAGVLLNADPNAGIPLTVQDGIIAGTGFKPAVFSGSTPLDIFTDGSKVGNSFWMSDGSWGNATPAEGPIPATNEVLIAQMTTDGVFSFELNILVQAPAPTDTGEYYVAKNPLPKDINHPEHCGDIQLTCLTYSSDINTDVKEVNPSSQVSIHPNPVRDLFTLEVNSSKHSENSTNDYYTIYGIAGNEIMHKNIGTVSGKYLENINVSSLTKGIYFIQLSIDGVTSTKKIIKN